MLSKGLATLCIFNEKLFVLSILLGRNKGISGDFLGFALYLGGGGWVSKERSGNPLILGIVLETPVINAEKERTRTRRTRRL